ncbi:MAG: hypothetical protein FJ218_02420 [Ignavibacteria bacterium]|nr:hypothetical protein [Ignavibacteria bacterium]
MKEFRRVYCFRSTYKMKKVLFYLALAVQIPFFGSCAGTIPYPNERHIQYAQSKWLGTTLMDLHQGRELYIVKCSGCHTLYEPQKRSEFQWNEILNEMKSRVKITEDETELILKYLISAQTNSSSKLDSSETQ